MYDKDHSYYSNRSACYAATDKFEEALSDGNKCVELKPDWAKGYGRVGYALFKLNQLEEAKAAYEKGINHSLPLSLPHSVTHILAPDTIKD